MRCIPHKAEAVAVCSYCGRALCSDCLYSPKAPRMVCSRQCADALAEGEKAMQIMLQHGRQNAKASAFYCYLCAGLSAVAAIAAWFMLPSPFLTLFTGGCALVLTASGVWYSRIAHHHSGSSPGKLGELDVLKAGQNTGSETSAVSSADVGG